MKPDSLHAEESLLACCLIDGDGGLDVVGSLVDRHLGPDWFASSFNRQIWLAIRDTYDSGQPVDEFSVGQLLHQRKVIDDHGMGQISSLANVVQSASGWQRWFDQVKTKSLTRKAITEATLTAERLKAGDDIEATLTRAEDAIAGILNLSGTKETRTSPRSKRREADLLKSAYEHAFDPEFTPPDDPPIIKLAGVPIWHVNNMLAILAPQKSGKTSSVTAMLSALMGPDGNDYMGFQGFNPNNLQLRYYDCEQSKKDFHWMGMRALRRAGIKKPDWFQSLHLKRYSPKERRAIVLADIKACHANGGIIAAVIDGAAGLVEDFNDLGECNRFVAEFLSLTETCNCGIAFTLHVNPGKGSDKGRGHLGTILEQLAETIILLTKERGTPDIITISTKDARHDTLENSPRSSWDNYHRMHRTLPDALAARRPQTKPNGKVDDLRMVAKDAIGRADALPYLALKKCIEDCRGVSGKTAERRIKELTAAKVIDRDKVTGFYRLCGDDETLDCNI